MVLFNNTKIVNYTEQFDVHFGQYPMIYLDLSKAKATTYDDIKAELGEVVFQIIVQYEYLFDDLKVKKRLRQTKY